MGRFLSTLVRCRIGPVRVIGVVAAVGVWLATFCFLHNTLPFPPRAVLEANAPQRDLGFSPDGRTLITNTWKGKSWHAEPGPVRLWDTTSGAQSAEFLSADTLVRYARITADNRWLVTREAPTPIIRVFDLRSHDEVLVLETPQRDDKSYSYFYLSPDSRVLAFNTFEDDEVCLQLWDIPARARVATFRGIKGISDVDGDYPSLRFSPNGTRFAAGERPAEDVANADSEVVVRDARTGERLARLQGCDGVVATLWFSSNGRHLLAECWKEGDATQSRPLSHSVCLWDLESQELMWKVPGALAGTFVDGDRFVVVSAMAGLQRLETAADSQPVTLFRFPPGVGSYHFPQTCSSGKAVWCWYREPIKGTPTPLRALESWLNIDFHPYVSLLVDIQSGLTVPAPYGRALSPDGTIVVDNGGDKTVLYDIPPLSRAPRAAFWASILAAAVVYVTRIRRPR